MSVNSTLIILLYWLFQSFKYHIMPTNKTKERHTMSSSKLFADKWPLPEGRLEQFHSLENLQHCPDWCKSAAGLANRCSLLECCLIGTAANCQVAGLSEQKYKKSGDRGRTKAQGQKTCLSHSRITNAYHIHSYTMHRLPCRMAGIIDATTPASNERTAVDNKINP